MVWVSTQLPSCAEHCPRDPLRIHPAQNIEVYYMTGGGEWMGEQQCSQKMEKDTWILLTAMQTSSGSLITNNRVWGCPQLVNRHPKLSIHLTHKHSHPLLAPNAPLRGAWASLCRQLLSTCRKVSQVWGIERKHTNLLIQHHLRESKPEAVSTRPSFAQDREKTYNLKNFPQGRTTNEEQA